MFHSHPWSGFIYFFCGCKVVQRFLYDNTCWTLEGINLMLIYLCKDVSRNAFLNVCYLSPLLIMLMSKYFPEKREKCVIYCVLLVYVFQLQPSLDMVFHFKFIMRNCFGLLDLYISSFGFWIVEPCGSRISTNCIARSFIEWLW